MQIKRARITRVVSWIQISIASIFLFDACQPGKEIIPVIPPTVFTGQIQDVSSSSAGVSGQILDDGNGTVTERGIVFGKQPDPEISGPKLNSGVGLGTFSVQLSGLEVNSTYHVRAYGINEAGVGYGLDISFQTAPGLPVLGETTAKLISSFSAELGGNVISEQGANVTTRGVCYGLSMAPDLSGKKTVQDGGDGAFQSQVLDLEPNKTYYLRAYATNKVGTAFGNEISIVTPDNKVADIDGNYYTYIKIGTQIWLGQDLRTTRYRNGDAIPEITDGSAWSQLSAGAFCYYENDPSKNVLYGKLYNWYAVADTRGICPAGWHSPTESEWLLLLTESGGLEFAGAKLKATNTWAPPNTGATNETLFTALPGGYRRTAGGYERILLDYWCWTSTSVSPDLASDVGLSFYSTYSSIGGGGNEKKYGNSARCIKD